MKPIFLLVFVFAHRLTLITGHDNAYNNVLQLNESWNYLVGSNFSADYSKCGYSNLVGNITRGVTNEREFGMHPYLGAMLDPSNLVYACEFILINNMWGITAAHCLSDSYNFTTVRFGDNLSKKITNNETQIYPVDVKIKKIIQYPNFNRNTRKNDVALVHLEHSVIFSEYLSPVCLLDGEQYLSDDFYNPASALFIGIGNLSHEKITWKDRLMPTVMASTCREEIKTEFNESVDSNEFCLENERRDCFGEASGMALFIKDNLLHLGGIVSRALECGQHSNVFYYPAIFTKTASFMEWIRNTTAV